MPNYALYYDAFFAQSINSCLLNSYLVILMTDNTSESNSTSKSDSIVGKLLTNLQSMFTGVESRGKAVEFGDKMIIPIYQFNFGIGGGRGNGGQGQRSTGFGFGLAGGIVYTAIVVLLKDKPGTDGIRIHEFKTGKTGQVLSEIISRIFEAWDLQMAGRARMTREKKEKLMSI
jgi:uncharacterized spore protein YtfJ